MELFWAAGFIFAIGFAIFNTLARDWSNPYYWLILGVFVIMAFDHLQKIHSVTTPFLSHPSPLIVPTKISLD